ncbi:MAG: hypothetical protein H6Q06_1136 [Acidobacteria bacterium]|nr:hypothetical protein [Acidobacteriota bacterium]
MIPGRICVRIATVMMLVMAPKMNGAAGESENRNPARTLDISKATPSKVWKNPSAVALDPLEHPECPKPC